jgi:hypothetical protein
MAPRNWIEWPWQIVRWLWKDLYHPKELRERLERAFERGLRAA